MLNIFRLNFEGSNNGSEEHLFSEFIQGKGMQREDLVRAKGRIHKILVESEGAGVSFTETFSGNSGKDIVNRDCRSGANWIEPCWVIAIGKCWPNFRWIYCKARQLAITEKL
jgi:hypothetical protein